MVMTTIGRILLWKEEAKIVFASMNKLRFTFFNLEKFAFHKGNFNIMHPACAIHGNKIERAVSDY